MKKLLMLLACMLTAISLSACSVSELVDVLNEIADWELGETIFEEESPDPPKKNDGSAPTQSEDHGIFNETLYWSDAIFKPYTTGVAEPQFTYTIEDIIDDKMCLNTRVSLAETKGWMQVLLDMGYETVLDEELYWSVKIGEKVILVNGSTAMADGEISIYISRG